MAAFGPVVEELCSNSLKYFPSHTIQDALESLELLFQVIFSLDMEFDIVDSIGTLENVLIDFETICGLFETLETRLNIRFFHSCPPSEDFMNYLRDYQTVAFYLNQGTNAPLLDFINNTILRMMRRLYSLRGDERKIVWTQGFTYLAAVGPSFMGKTQLAFNLAYNRPVLYFNFSTSNPKQPIYLAFDHISATMIKCLKDDEDVFPAGSKPDYNGPATAYLTAPTNSHFKFWTLGLILGFLEQSVNFDFDSSGEWLEFLVNVGSFAYRKISLLEFYKEYRKYSRRLIIYFSHQFFIDQLFPNSGEEGFRQPVIFIDEFSKTTTTMFLRSLAKAIVMPCILSSSNSKISNMLTSVQDCSRGLQSDWCHVFTKLPPTDFDGVLHSVSVARDDESPRTKLSSFLSILTDGSDDVHGVYGLLSHLRVTVDAVTNSQIIKFFKIIKQQSKTCLPGLTYLAIESLIKVLKEHSHGPLILLEKCLDRIFLAITQRKFSLMTPESVLFSLDTFALYPKQSDAESGHHEGPASYSIDKHFYYFGERPSSYNSIILKRDDALVYYANGSNFVVKSHFSRFFEDVFLHFIVWRHIEKLKFKLFPTIPNVKLTVAQIIQITHDGICKWPNTEALSNDSNAQEYMTNLVVGHASHQRYDGMTDGVSFLEEFIVHLQIIHISEDASSNLPLNRLAPTFPSILKDFLEHFVSIPYLVPQLPEGNQIPDCFDNMFRFGVSRRLKNLLGFDINFDLNGTDKLGWIECKNRQRNTARKYVLDYLLPAMKLKSPFVLMVSLQIGISLCSSSEFNRFEFSSTEAEIQTQKKTRIICTLKEIIQDERNKDPTFPKDFDVNVYSVFYPESLNQRSSPKEMICVPLYEVEGKAPDGVFIVVETNCELSTRPRSIVETLSQTTLV